MEANSYGKIPIPSSLWKRGMVTVDPMEELKCVTSINQIVNL